MGQAFKAPPLGVVILGSELGYQLNYDQEPSSLLFVNA